MMKNKNTLQHWLRANAGRNAKLNIYNSIEHLC
jgi:hypothetical protein